MQTYLLHALAASVKRSVIRPELSMRLARGTGEQLASALVTLERSRLHFAV